MTLFEVRFANGFIRGLYKFSTNFLKQLGACQNEQRESVWQTLSRLREQ